MSQRLKHAERNKALSQQLFEQGDFFDWVVTTAFYSAIHFIEHKLFVVDAGVCGYTSTNDYKIKRRCLSPHDARLQLVIRFLPELHRWYEKLDKASRDARYFNYDIDRGEAEKSLQRLYELSRNCV